MRFCDERQTVSKTEARKKHEENPTNEERIPRDVRSMAPEKSRRRVRFPGAVEATIWQVPAKAVPFKKRANEKVSAPRRWPKAKRTIHKKIRCPFLNRTSGRIGDRSKIGQIFGIGVEDGRILRRDKSVVQA